MLNVEPRKISKTERKLFGKTVEELSLVFVKHVEQKLLEF